MKYNFLILTFLLLAACKSKEDKIRMSVQSPKEGDVYHYGDTIPVKFTISYDKPFGYGAVFMHPDTIMLPQLFVSNNDDNTGTIHIDSFWVNHITGSQPRRFHLTAGDNQPLDEGIKIIILVMTISIHVLIYSQAIVTHFHYMVFN